MAHLNREASRRRRLLRRIDSLKVPRGVSRIGGTAFFIEALLRCAAPCQSRSRAISPPSRYPYPSQAVFARSIQSPIPPIKVGAGSFRLRSCNRACRPAGSPRAEAQRNRSPRVFAEPSLVLRTSWYDDIARPADPLFAAQAELHLTLEHPHNGRGRPKHGRVICRG